MRKYLTYILFLLPVSFAFSSVNSFAQTDSTLNNSAQNVALISQAYEEQRLADSIKKVELEAQLLSARKADKLKREELQKQLDELNARDAKRIEDKRARIDSLRLTAKSFPVYGLFKDTLFFIYSRAGSFSARDRAMAISSRIKTLAGYSGFSKDSLLITAEETSVEISFGETIIISVSENDALWNNSSQAELAKNYKEIIGNELMKYSTQTSFAMLSEEIGLALLVIIITGILIFYLSKFFRWTAKKISSQEGKRIKGVKIKTYTLFDSRREVNTLLFVNNIVKWIFLLLILYITLPILFGIFPWTKHFADKLFSYILNPAKKMAWGVWNYLPNLITILVIIVIFRYALKGIYSLKNEIEKGNLRLSGFYPDWANPTYQIIRVVIYAFMLVVIFPYLPGSDSPVFQGVSVFLGVLFTFGSSGSLSNIVAGLVLTYMRLFKIGDCVKIGEIVGVVIEKSLLVSRVRTIKNEIISIPNSTVMNSHTLNYSSETANQGLILHTTVTIGYDVPWKNMHQALLNAADRTNLVLEEPKPFVLQTSLDDFYVSYQINAYTKEATKQAVIYSELHCNIQDCCNEAGIEILSPHYRSARDGNATSIPSDYLDKDYKAPTFNVSVKNENK